MDQRTRMWKTLACLVAAMTSTTLLLGWMDPSQSLTRAAPSSAEMVHMARTVVDADLGVHLGQWTEIEVVTGRPQPTSRAMLAAGGQSRKCHFFVDRDGCPLRARWWRDQQAPADAPQTVRIEIAQPRGGVISLAQKLCVRSLIAALNETLIPEGGLLSVRLPRNWGTASVDREETPVSGTPLLGYVVD